MSDWPPKLNWPPKPKPENGMIYPYRVEGIPVRTFNEAMVLATRLFERYDRTRDIEIWEVDGDAPFRCQILIAEKHPEPGDDETLDLF